MHIDFSTFVFAFVVSTKVGQSYYPRTPQDTPGHINTLKDTFIRSFLFCF